MMNKKIWKRSLAKSVSAALCVMMTLSLTPAYAFAEEGAEAQDTVEAAGEAAAEPTAAPIDAPAAVETVVSNVIRTNQLDGWPEASEKESDYVCLLDTSTGTVLIDKNMDAQASPAALTKIMTTLTAIENGNLDDVVTMTQTGVDLAVAGSANLYTVVGEQFTLRDMLYGVMLASANDMAVQVAEYVGGGSVDNFVAMMNERAEELGCTGTHFVNASGMTADGQVSTAHDLALISVAALQNADFRAIASASTYTIPATSIYAARELTNNFPCLADPATYAIKGVFGGKTGYTDAAQNCIAAYCNRDGREEVLIALHCNDINKSVNDAKESFQYGYNKWKLRKVKVKEGEELLSGGNVLTPKKKKISSCEKAETVTDKEDNKEQVDTIYYWAGVEVGKSSILRTKAIQVPTNAPQQTESAVGPLANNETQLPVAGNVENGFSNLNAAINGAAEGTAADGTAAAPAATDGTVAAPAAADGTVAAPAADGTAAAPVTADGTAAAPAADGTAAAPAAADGTVAAPGAADGTAGTEGAPTAVDNAAAAPVPQTQTTERVQASEQNAAQKVALPFGVIMNRNSFIAIAVLSLLILLGIILILLTAVVRRHRD